MVWIGEEPFGRETEHEVVIREADDRHYAALIRV